MDFPFEGLSFGDFSDLSPEENCRILNILHGPKNSVIGNHPKFPWGEDEKFPIEFGHSSSDECTPDRDTFSNAEGFSFLNPSVLVGNPGVCDYVNHNEQQLVEDQKQLDPAPQSAPEKTKERRNKKKRPPGYYDSLYQGVVDNSVQDNQTVTNHPDGKELSSYVNSENNTQPEAVSFVHLINQQQNEGTSYYRPEENKPRTKCDSVVIDVEPELIDDNLINYQEDPVESQLDTNFKTTDFTEVGDSKTPVAPSSDNNDDDDNHAIDTNVNCDKTSVEKSNTSSETGETLNETPPCTQLENSAWKKPTQSWASLFKSRSTPSKDLVIEQESMTEMVNVAGNEVDNSKPELKVDTPLVSANEDMAAKELGELLINLQLSHRPTNFQPKGLINRGNWCYVNATLQALSACPPFYHLVKALPLFPPLTRGPSSTPAIDSFVEFFDQFVPLKTLPPPVVNNAQSNSKGKKERAPEISTGSPFEPVYVYKMIQKVKNTESFKHGKQEDAEEFLTHVLNALHDEMVAAIDVSKGKIPNSNEEGEETSFESTNGYTIETEEYIHDDNDNDDDAWEQVGPKKKSVITRVANFANSPLSDIFCGQMRSVLHQPGSRESATLQPFFTLQLDIQSDKVLSVKDALEGLFSKEAVQGYTCVKTKQEVDATRKSTFEVLPPILILHLKCFVYNKDGGCQKVMKRIDYPVELDISKDLLSPTVKSKLTQAQRTYKLCAVVYHHGKFAAGGHYTSDVYHSGISGWIHIDDSLARPVSLNQVLKFSNNRMPYLLFYRRSDYI